MKSLKWRVYSISLVKSQLSQILGTHFSLKFTYDQNWSFDNVVKPESRLTLRLFGKCAQGLTKKGVVKDSVSQ